MSEKQTPPAVSGRSLTSCSPVAMEWAREDSGKPWRVESPMITVNSHSLEKLIAERNKYRSAIERIEEIYIDGDDTYEDWNTMGKISREILENTYY